LCISASPSCRRIHERRSSGPGVLEDNAYTLEIDNIRFGKGRKGRQSKDHMFISWIFFGLGGHVDRRNAMDLHNASSGFFFFDKNLELPYYQHVEYGMIQSEK
jgi:hypothetical protein